VSDVNKLQDSCVSIKDHVPESKVHSHRTQSSKYVNLWSKYLSRISFNLKQQICFFEKILRLCIPTKTNKVQPIIAWFHYYSDLKGFASWPLPEIKISSDTILVWASRYPKGGVTLQDLYPIISEEKNKGNICQQQ